MVTVRWRKLLSEELHDFYFLPNISKEKVKAIPLQVRTGLEGSRRLRLPDFRTINT